MNHESALSTLFTPEAIAVVGASGNRSRIGGRPVTYCRRLGFGG